MSTSATALWLAAKAYKKKPIDIASEVVEKLNGDGMFSEINAVMPGFINIRLNALTWLIS